MRELLRFQPLYQARVWGGRALESAFGRPLPGAGPIGESWEVVDRAGAQSVVEGGTLNGQSLHAVLETHGAEIMGPKWPAGARFPILVKWLDCRERLSLQVHPPVEVAAGLNGEPKTENWFIAHAVPGAELIVGLKRGVSRAQFERAICSHALEQCVHHFPVAAGDSILVRSGQVHAIGAGNLVLEIQQNSDTTYRVYDWGRMGLDGAPRELHLSQSLRSIDWTDFEPAPVRALPISGIIADCAEFRIRRVVLRAEEQEKIRGGEQPRLLSIVSGSLFVTSKINGGTRAPDAPMLTRGANLLAPFDGDFTLSADTPAILLITENFVSRS